MWNFTMCSLDPLFFELNLLLRITFHPRAWNMNPYDNNNLFNLILITGYSLACKKTTRPGPCFDDMRKCSVLKCNNHVSWDIASPRIDSKNNTENSQWWEVITCYWNNASTGVSQLDLNLPSYNNAILKCTLKWSKPITDRYLGLEKTLHTFP